jgi:hypothetical protein
MNTAEDEDVCAACSDVVLVVLQGMKNPLDSVSQITPRAATKPEDKAHKAATGMYQYFLKVRWLTAVRDGRKVKA